MKRDEILSMPAGREMDALVWMALHDQEPNIIMCRFVDGDYQPHAGYPSGHISPPHYSTDIAAAWEAVEHLKEIKPILNYDPYSRKWYMRFNGGNSYTAETAPLAICRAALLAVMEAS